MIGVHWKSHGKSDTFCWLPLPTVGFRLFVMTNHCRQVAGEWPIITNNPFRQFGWWSLSCLFSIICPRPTKTLIHEPCLKFHWWFLLLKLGIHHQRNWFVAIVLLHPKCCHQKLTLPNFQLSVPDCEMVPMTSMQLDFFHSAFEIGISNHCTKNVIGKKFHQTHQWCQIPMNQKSMSLCFWLSGGASIHETPIRLSKLKPRKGSWLGKGKMTTSFIRCKWSLHLQDDILWFQEQWGLLQSLCLPVLKSSQVCLLIHRTKTNVVHGSMTNRLCWHQNDTNWNSTHHAWLPLQSKLNMEISCFCWMLCCFAEAHQREASHCFPQMDHNIFIAIGHTMNFLCTSTSIGMTHCLPLCFWEIQAQCGTIFHWLWENLVATTKPQCETHGLVNEGERCLPMSCHAQHK